MVQAREATRSILQLVFAALKREREMTGQAIAFAGFHSLPPPECPGMARRRTWLVSVAGWAGAVMMGQTQHVRAARAAEPESYLKFARIIMFDPDRTLRVGYPREC